MLTTVLEVQDGAVDVAGVGTADDCICKTTHGCMLLVRPRDQVKKDIESLNYSKLTQSSGVKLKEKKKN